MQTNIDFAAELIKNELTALEIIELNKLLRKVDNALFKSYLKELPFNELKQAVEEAA